MRLVVPASYLDSTCDEKDIHKFIEEQQAVQENIDKLWISIKQELSKLDTNVNISVATDSLGHKHEPNIHEGVRLPKLNLPTFSGYIHDWLSFRDLFVASIHNNNKLSESQKLSYLKVSLHGEASRIVQSIPLCDSNYT
ncbi:hypothetical protein X975_07621, partial [Stegodyphus mimosarum]